MADKQISDLTSASALTDGSLFVIEQSGAAKSANWGMMKNYIAPNVAPQYSASSTYGIGDYVVYNNQLYRCRVDISTAEAWTSSHWTATVLSNEVTGVYNEDYIINAIGSDGEYTYSAGDWEKGSWAFSVKGANSSRLRTKCLIPIRTGVTVSYSNPTLKLYIGVLSTRGASSYSQMSGWIAAGSSGEYTILNDGYLALILEGGSGIAPSDYDCTIKIIKHPTNQELGNRLDIVGRLNNNNASDEMVPVTPGTSSFNGISWTATKTTIKAERTASNSNVSFFSLFESNDSIPDTMEAGGVYEVKYSSENIDLIVYDRTSGSLVVLFRTFDGGTLAIPETTTSLYIRLVVHINAISVGSSETVAVPQFLNAMTNKELSTAVSSLASNADKIAVQSYSDITVSSKRWDENMKLGDSSVLGHTQNYKIIPGADYYVGTIGYVNNGVMGCFLDFNELPLKPLRASDCSEVSYPYTTDNPNTDFTLFTKLYKFTVPANAHYLSLNFILTASEHWKFFLSNIPMFREGNSGDLVVYENSHMLHKKAKKLCVVGPSYAMIDRRIQSAYGNKYIVGFQEYLLPFYDSITTFGYSGGTWGQFRDSDYISIYSGIVSGYGSVLPKDFTPFDEVLLIGCNPNGFFSTPRQEEGTAGTYDSNTSPVSSFMGGMRGVVEYILNQKPEMKIYLSNFWHTSGNNVSAFRDTCDNLNAEMLKLANLFGLQYIDMYNSTPFNKWNYTTSNLQYTYDGTHPNNAGMREIADVLVRAMI